MTLVEPINNGNDPPARTLNLKFSDEKQKWWPNVALSQSSLAITGDAFCHF